MTQRPVFEAFLKAPFNKEVPVSFKFNPGFSVSQKQKNISALHESYLRENPGKHVLEISSKSPLKVGIELSAFNLKVKTRKGEFPLESFFQASKVFKNGGPYLDLISLPPIEAKRDARLKESGKLTGFIFYDKKFPNLPLTFFYDWLYVNTLIQNQHLAKEVTKFDAFTDIEFNPNKSINCQAKSAAVFKSLHEYGYNLSNKISPEDYYNLVYPEKINSSDSALFNF